MHFSSDGSNNDWGFALRAEAVLPVYEEEKGQGDGVKEEEEEEVNRYPWYLGQPPARVTRHR